MIALVWAALVAALPSPPSRYRGKRRVSAAQLWDEAHRLFPWQRARRRVCAWLRLMRRPTRHTAGAAPRARVRPVVVTAEVAAWQWWQERRKAYEPALRAAGAWS